MFHCNNNCADFCPESQYICHTEGTCLDSHMACDGFPDCLGNVQGMTDLMAVDEVAASGCIEGESACTVS